MAGFVDAAADRGVRMAIDDSGRDVHSLAVDDQSAARRFKPGPDGGDFTGGNEQIGVL